MTSMAQPAARGTWRLLKRMESPMVKVVPFPGLALHPDGAAHQIHNALGNGHAQAGSLDSPVYKNSGPVKNIFEKSGLYSLAHAHAGIS